MVCRVSLESLGQRVSAPWRPGNTRCRCSLGARAARLSGSAILLPVITITFLG
jgi:hypothetical protein